MKVVCGGADKPDLVDLCRRMRSASCGMSLFHIPCLPEAVESTQGPLPPRTKAAQPPHFVGAGKTSGIGNSACVR